MTGAPELLEADGGALLGAEVRTRIQDAPETIVHIATAIADTRGRTPAASVTRACIEELPLIYEAKASTLMEALEPCLLGRDVDAALEWLHKVGFIAEYLPELSATVDLAQEAGRRHKDVWEHTKLVVKQAVRRPSVRWAALLHDIGKVPTRTFTQKGVHFHGHAEVGARMFDRMRDRLPFAPAMRRKVRFLIKHHLRSNQYSTEWTDSAVRRFTRDVDEHLQDLLDLSRADITSQRPGRRQALLRQISQLQDRVEQLREIDAKQPPLPKGLGTAIIERFALPPSRIIGDLRRALEQAAERGDIQERREFEYYLDWLESSGLIADARRKISPPGDSDQ